MLLYAHAFDVIYGDLFVVFAVRIVERVRKVIVGGMKQVAKNRDYRGGGLVNLVFLRAVVWKVD